MFAVYQLALLVVLGTSLITYVDGVSFKYNKVETFVINDGDDSMNIDTQKIGNGFPSFPGEMQNSFLALLLKRKYSSHHTHTGTLSFNNKDVSSILTDDFHWKSCGPADQLVDIRNLTIKPSPLYFPGQLSFGFDILFHDTVQEDASVSASVQLQFNKGGGSWITIPCIGQIGSCTYNDFCSLTKLIQCPDDLKQKGIPCTCPFNKGEYKLNYYDIDVDAQVFLTGNYQAQVTITDSSKGQIACYVVNFTIG